MSPRPPRSDGQGDQRRAHEIVAALSAEWDVVVVSWLPDVDLAGARRWITNPVHLLRALTLSVALPLQVAYVQGRAPRSLPRLLAGSDVVVFVTDRAARRRVPSAAIVDFVDDLGGVALRRVESSGRLGALFWRWEGGRVRRHDRRLSRRASVAVAHSEQDAAGIGETVRTIPLSVGSLPLDEEGTRIVFFGNLFYSPNHEAAMWICTELAPELVRRGVDPDVLLLAGRRPHSTLSAAAAASGVELRADVADLSDVLREAAVVMAPMRLGSGAQYKVLDAIGAGRPCVLSPVANGGLDLVEGRSALIRQRDVEPFADAVLHLLDDQPLRRRLADEARAATMRYMPESVAESWRATVRDLLDVAPSDTLAEELPPSG